MTGKACISVTKYYDRKTQRIGLKERPVLIIGNADPADFVALPISRITFRQNIDQEYDYPLEIPDYPTMKLTEKSYIRSHKQFIANASEITKVICDFRADYPDAYIAILELVERFQKKLLENAL